MAAGGTLTLDDVRQYAAELVCVLSHLHQNGIVYVDLKPENVLLQVRRLCVWPMASYGLRCFLLRQAIVHLCYRTCVPLPSIHDNASS